MPLFDITIKDSDGTNGSGPIRVVAPTPADAVRFAAATEGRSLEQLGAAGLTVHTVKEV